MSLELWTAAAALLVALIALAVGVVAWRRADDADRDLRAHRDREHRRGQDTRQVDYGPPAGTPERRRHAAPAGERARRRDADDPQYATRPVGAGQVEPPVSFAPPVREQPERVTGLPPVPATEQLEAADRPTTQMPALPRPGSIRPGGQ